LHQVLGVLKVTYARLKCDSIEFSATDWLHPARVSRPGNTVAIDIQADDYGQLRALFDKLAVGADKHDSTTFGTCRSGPTAASLTDTASIGSFEGLPEAPHSRRVNLKMPMREETHD
jgi:hypothetical protein